MLTGRNQAAGVVLANELGARFVAGDIADPAFPDRLMAETLAAFGGLDILINNAGITHRGSILETTDDDWARVMDVNVTALMRCSRAALKHMVAAGKGSIVNIASDFAVVAGQREAVYCASKGAVLQLTKAMALDHGPQGVRVNAVCPGDVETPMLLEGIQSGGEEGLLTGDVAHHPCQMAHLDWSSTADSDPVQSAATRRQLFSRFADTATLVIGGHFSAAHIKRDGDAFKFIA